MSRDPGNSVTFWDVEADTWWIKCRESGCDWSASGKGLTPDTSSRAYRAHWRETHKEYK